MSSAADHLFRFASTLRRDPAVEAWLRACDGELGDLARYWFGQMRRCGDDVTELLHDGCPVACVNGAAFAYVNVFRTHVNVGFFLGSDLDDPAALLDGTGRRMRHVKLRPHGPVDALALQQLIEDAYAGMHRQLQTPTPSPGPASGK